MSDPSSASSSIPSHRLGKLSSVISIMMLLISLTRQELRKRYAGSVGGLMWAFAQPLLTIIIYHVVFSLALKVQFENDVPFTIVFVAALIPWMTFADSVSFGARSIISLPHLVTSMNFPVPILPVVPIITAFIVQVAMLVIFALLLAVHGRTVPFAVLQLPYYVVALSAFALGIGWIVAALAVLFRDVVEITNICLSLGFWTLPIVWPLSRISLDYRWLVEDNPLWYVVNGYRQSLIYGHWFWSDPVSGLRFWVVTLLVLGGGWSLFKRLRGDFADVL